MKSKKIYPSYKVGSILRFTYKNGKPVSGVVKEDMGKNILLILNTDYIGKNEEWFIGEDKVFNKGEMKNTNCSNK